MFFWKKRDRERVIRAYREVFNSEAGQIVLEDLIKSCHVLHSTFDPNTNETYYKEGERSVVIRILKTVNIDPFKFQEMIKKGQSEG
jgi:hypothetical protein